MQPLTQSWRGILQNVNLGAILAFLSIGALNLYGYLSIIPISLRPFIDAQVIFKYYLWMTLIFAFSSYLARQFAPLLSLLGEILYRGAGQSGGLSKRQTLGFILLGSLPTTISSMIFSGIIVGAAFLYYYIGARYALFTASTLFLIFGLPVIFIFLFTFFSADTRKMSRKERVAGSLDEVSTFAVSFTSNLGKFIPLVVLIALIFSFQIGRLRALSTLVVDTRYMVSFDGTDSVIFTVTSDGMIIVNNIVVPEGQKTPISATFHFFTHKGEKVVSKIANL